MNWIENLMAKQAVQYLLKRGGFMFNFLDGYKTYVAAVLMIITGALQMAGYAPDVIQTSIHGWDLIMAGIAAIGVGHKLEKIVSK